MMPKKYDDGSGIISVSIDKAEKIRFERKNRRKRNNALRAAIILINNTLHDEHL